MEYTVPFHSEISGDVVPLRYIAEAMARKAASGFGKRKLHGPTLQNARAQYESLLLSAAREGRLKVCGSHGNMGAVDDLVNAAEGLSNEWSDAVKAILALHVKPSHLSDWAMTNGDVFHLIDVPADVLEYGPARPDGTKEYRGYVAWPFECFGEHGYFDAGQDGIPIELADGDFEADGFVKVAGAAAAVAKFLLSKGSPNEFQAERDAWPHILTGVVKGVLHPVSPTTLSPLSVEHCGNGMVLFSELVAWGQTTKLFAFRKAANAPVVELVKVGAGGTAKPEWVQQAREIGTTWMLAEEKRTKKRPGIVVIAKYVEGEFKRRDIRSKRLNDYLDWQTIKKEIVGITGRKPGDNFKNAMGNPQRKKRSPNVMAQ